jgi:hypothetical protein
VHDYGILVVVQTAMAIKSNKVTTIY